MPLKLKAVADSLDDLPDVVHELYTERDGKFVLTGIDDATLLPGVAKLKSENAQRRLAETAANEALKKYSPLKDLDITDILAKLEKYPELELAADGKVDEGKINTIVETRLKAKLSPVERERDALKTGIQERDVKISEFEKKERTRTIHDSVRGAIVNIQGFQQAAIEDALMYAERMLEVSEDGQVVTRDNVGVTPGLQASVWLTEMQQKKPHWWGPSAGGGANPNRPNGGGFGSNPWTSETWNVTEQGKILSTDRKRAEQLAKSAGTTIGGLRPAAKK